MKLCLMTYTLARQPGFNLEAALKLGQELGLTGVDFVTLHGRTPRDLKRLAADHGLHVACYVFAADINQADSRLLQQGIDSVKRGVEEAVEMGAPCVMFNIGSKPAYTPEQARANCYRAFGRALEVAREAGVILTTENMHGVNTPFVTADDLLDAIRHFPTLRFTYDNGNCLTGGDDPAVSFTRTAPYVAHVHFKDWIQRASPEGCVGARSGKFFKPELIGEGVIDHRSVLSAMRSAKYSGFIDIEYEGDRYPAAQAVRKAVEYLRTLCPELR